MENNALRTIRVYGTLAKILKRRKFQAVVRSPLDAINFLLSNFPELQTYIEPRAFQITVNDKPINEHQLATPVDLSANEIRIIPAICGAGGDNSAGLVSILAGAALIGASFLFPLAAPILLPLGIGLVLTGVAALIAPVTPEDEDRSDPSASYIFNGVQNTSREGVAVPCVYGEVITGSVTISLGIIQDEDEIEEEFEGGTGDPNPPENQFPEGGVLGGQYPYSYGVEADGTVLETNPRNSYEFLISEDTDYPCGTPCNPLAEPTIPGNKASRVRTSYYWGPQPFYGRAIMFDIRQDVKTYRTVCSGGDDLSLTALGMVMRVYDYSACNTCEIIEGWSIPTFGGAFENPEYGPFGTVEAQADSGTYYVERSYYIQLWRINNAIQPIPGNLQAPSLSGPEFTNVGCYDA